MNANEAPTGGEKPVLENLAAEIRLRDVDTAIGTALLEAARRDLAAWTHTVADELRKDFDLVAKDAARRAG